MATFYLSKTPLQMKLDVKGSPGQPGLPEQGLQLVSLSVHGVVGAPRFAAVWWPHASFPAQRFDFGEEMMGMTLEEARKKVVVNALQSFFPTHVAVVGAGPETARFFIVSELRDSGIKSLVRLDVELADLKVKKDGEVQYRIAAEARGKKRFMRWACLYGTMEAPYVAYVLDTQPKRGDTEKPAKASPVAWHYEPFDDVQAVAEKVGAYAQGGVRPALIAPLARSRRTRDLEGTMKDYGSVEPKRRDIEDYLDGATESESVVTYFLSLWHDDVIGGWTKNYEIGNWWCAFDDLSAEDFAAADQQAVKWGLKPTRIMGSGSGDGTRFAVIWATEERPAERIWKVTRLTPSVRGGAPPAPDPFKKFDKWMEAFMKNRGIRAGQLAISRGGKLVCARSYRWAEPGFVLTPFTTFRIGSVSKILTALSVWQIIEQTADKGPDEKLTPTMDVTNAARLEEYVEAGPFNPGYAQLQSINVAGLLNHTSGCRSGFDGDTVAVHSYTGSSYPLGAQDYVKYAVNKAAINIDGPLVGKHRYSNFGYFLLQEVVRARGKSLFVEVNEYVQVLEQGVLMPLQITKRPHPAKLAIENRRAGEVICQTVNPSVVRSLAHDDNRLAYRAYGAPGSLNAGIGTGGWAMAAVDLTRILAALRPSTASVLSLSPETMKRLFEPPFQPFFPSPVEVTDGGWEARWSWDGGDFDLTVLKTGTVVGGFCFASVWNPSGPESKIVTIVLCLNSSDGFDKLDVLSAFRGYLAGISKFGSWPEEDLFGEVTDDSP